MKTFLTLVACLMMISLFGQKDAELVKNLMQKQQEAWNRFDIEGFMEHYWKSDSLKFIGKSGLTYGWQKTLDNYKKSYPNAEAMGKLMFNLKSVEQLSKTSVYVIGQWGLDRGEKSVGGYFTLLWKKINGKWVIVADHTS